MATKLLPPVHPGEILREEFMRPLELSSNALARAIGVTPARVNDIASEKRGITADSALRLSRYFGTTPELWTCKSVMNWKSLAANCAASWRISGRVRLEHGSWTTSSPSSAASSLANTPGMRARWMTCGTTKRPSRPITRKQIPDLTHFVGSSGMTMTILSGNPGVT